MFPDQFPMPQVIELVTLIREGKAQDDLAYTAKLGLWIAGCTIETFFTQDDEVGITSYESPTTIEEALQKVDELGPKGEVSTRFIDPALILAIIELIQLIMKNRG